MYLMFSIMITVCVKEYAKTIEIIFAAKHTAWKNKAKKMIIITFKIQYYSCCHNNNSPFSNCPQQSNSC